MICVYIYYDTYTQAWTTRSGGREIFRRAAVTVFWTGLFWLVYMRFLK